MDPVFVAAGFALVIVYRVYRRYIRISVADVPGPESPSFIMGMSVSVKLLVFSIANVTIREFERALSRTCSRDWLQVASSVWECHSLQGRIWRMQWHVHLWRTVSDSWFTGRPIGDFGPRCLAIHVCKVRLSVRHTGKSPGPLRGSSRKGGYIGGRYVFYHRHETVCY
jgi:hypothetical protein